MENQTADADLPETQTSPEGQTSSEGESARPTQPEPADTGPAETPQFAVPLTIELEHALVPLERLQALREGAFIPLAVEAGVIPVRILASGRPLARGTLVSVGESYGVLIGDPEEA